jgi:stage V sporulation protein G
VHGWFLQNIAEQGDLLMITITDVNISRLFRDRQIIAVCTVTVNDALAIHDIMLYKGEKGMYVQMPHTKRDGKNLNICHPINNEARTQITQAVISKYDELKAS